MILSAQIQSLECANCRLNDSTEKYQTEPHSMLLTRNFSQFLSVQGRVLKLSIYSNKKLIKVRRAQLAKSPLLTSTLLPLGSFQIF